MQDELSEVIVLPWFSFLSHLYVGKKSFENRVIEDIEVVDDTPVNESDFPSLQEAAMMASGVKPQTKPKNQTQTGE